MLSKYVVRLTVHKDDICIATSAQDLGHGTFGCAGINRYSSTVSIQYSNTVLYCTVYYTVVQKGSEGFSEINSSAE